MTTDGTVYPTRGERISDGIADDVSLEPAAHSDPGHEIAEHISQEVRALYDVYSYRHAASILATAFPQQLEEIEDALLAFRITTRDIAMPGGNESTIPKLFSATLRPAGWRETRIQGDLVVRVFEHDVSQSQAASKRPRMEEKPPLVLENYIDGHKIDYVRDRVALDLEWNSKDQTFDRDLYAFRMFHECGIISAAVLITRSALLNPVFESLPLLAKDGSVDHDKDGKPKMCKQKYGASTTWMGKLLYRLNAGRHGGCPVLVFGITPGVIDDWPEQGVTDR